MNIAIHHYPGYIYGFFERRTKAMLVPEMQVEIYFKQFPLQDQSITIIGKCGVCKPHIIRLAYVFQDWSECMLLALSWILSKFHSNKLQVERFIRAGEHAHDVICRERSNTEFGPLAFTNEDLVSCCVNSLYWLNKLAMLDNHCYPHIHHLRFHLACPHKRNHQNLLRARCRDLGN